MKRFTDTDKWDQEWFMRLDPKFKLAWMFLCDKCDIAGFWEINLTLLHVYTGTKCEIGDIIDAMGGRVVLTDSGKLMVLKFIAFQQGTDELNPSNNAHLGIIRRLEKEGMSLEKYQGLVRGWSGAQEVLARTPGNSKGKSKGKDRGAGERIEAIYNAYPKKVGKVAALKSIERALKKVDAETLQKAVESFSAAKAGTDTKFIPNPATWFNQGRWMDDPETWKVSDGGFHHKQGNFNKKDYGDDGLFD